MATTQKRAKVGGEVGTNGDFYEGGKFLPSTERPKTAPAQTVRKARKEQFEPYKWEVPAEGMSAIFGMIVGTQARQNQDGTLSPFAPGVEYYGEMAVRFGVTFGSVADLCERYNRGERWVKG